MEFTNLTFLFVDDEEDILEIMQINAEKEFPHSIIQKCTDGKNAIKLLADGFKPDMVITDLKMPEMNGLTLAKKILEINPQIPIVMHSSYLEIMNTVENAEIGFSGILDKMSNSEQFASEIKRILSSPNSSRDEYLPLSLDKLVEKKVFPFNIYLRIAPEKFIHAFKKDESIDKDKMKVLQDTGVRQYFIKSKDYQTIDESIYLPIKTSVLKPGTSPGFPLFKKHGTYRFEKILKPGTVISDKHLQIFEKHSITELYFNNADEKKYLDYLNKIILNVVNNDKIKIVDKSKFISEYALSHMKNAYEKPDDANLPMTIPVATGLVEFSHSSNNVVILLSLINLKKTVCMFRHVIKVALLSLGMFEEIIRMRKNGKTANQVKVFDSIIHDNKTARETLALAALLHDIGKIPLDIRTDINLDDMTKKEKKAYLKHSEVGMKLLEEKYIFPGKVVEIIGQHDEFVDGSGIPNGLLKNKISIYAQIISVANYFDNMLNTGMKINAVFNNIEKNIDKFNKHLIPILRKIVILPKKGA